MKTNSIWVASSIPTGPAHLLTALLLLAFASLPARIYAQDDGGIDVPAEVKKDAGADKGAADLDALLGELGAAADEKPKEGAAKKADPDLEALFGEAEKKAEEPAAEGAPAAANVDDEAAKAVEAMIAEKDEEDKKDDQAVAEVPAAGAAQGDAAEAAPAAPVVEPTPEELESNERVRRKELELMAEHHVISALEHYRKGEFAEAAKNYKDALDELDKITKSAPRVLKRREQIKSLLFNLHADWATSLAKDARRLANAERCDEAIEKCHLAAEYDPARREEMDERIKRFLELKRDVEVRDMVRPDRVDVEKVERDFDINVLYEQGKVFFNNRRYADARDLFEQILLKDPYEVRAIRYLRMINERLVGVAEEKHHAVTAERVAEVRWKWSEPVTPLLAGPAAEIGGEAVRKSEQATGIRAKLQDIIIPQIEFDEMPVAEVIRVLKRRSMELDPDGEGVNIFLQLKSAEGDTAPAQEVEPGFDDDFGGGGGGGFGGAEGGGGFGGAEGGGGFGEPAAGGGFGEPAGGGFDAPGGGFDAPGGFGPEEPAAQPDAPQGGGVSQRLITMNMDNIPLGEVIRYICMGAGLKFRVESNAVIIADKSVALDEMETRFYAVEAGVLDATKTRRAAAMEFGEGGDDKGWSDDDDDNGGGGEDELALMNFFQGFGVDFPQGSRVSYYQRTGKLVLHNTPENIRKVEKVLQEINVTPTQVTIEAKFVEIQQTDLDTLGFEWFMQGGGVSYNAAVAQGGGSYSDHFLASDTNGEAWIGSNGSDFQFGGNAANGDYDNPITQGLRYAADVGEFNLPSGFTDALFSTYTILGDIAFETVIHALNRQDQVDVLSAPKVTTLSGNTAVLRTVQERYFPESWTEPEVTASSQNTGSSFKPSIPEFGEARDIGVVLEVTPTVAADGYSIDLDLRPQVIDFISFDESFDYDMVVDGETIRAKATMPILSARTVETKVIVWDGETVVLGGMIGERIDKYEDKVPLLSEVPLLGPLFKSSGEKSFKTNLLIFVTARLVNPAGLPIRANEIRGMHDFRR